MADSEMAGLAPAISFCSKPEPHSIVITGLVPVISITGALR
jgi:hypothetical protein